jgi:hypothetical protein
MAFFIINKLAIAIDGTEMVIAPVLPGGVVVLVSPHPDKLQRESCTTRV